VKRRPRSPLPQAPSGSGQSVTAFGPDANGTDDMVAKHGYGVDGPITLRQPRLSRAVRSSLRP